MSEVMIEAGNKVEIEHWKDPESQTEEPSIWISQVLEVSEGNHVKIAMPTEKTHMILLQVEEEYELHFYTQDGTFSCVGRVTDRYKEDTFSIAEIEMVSSLEKLQRRQFFRAECVRPVHFYALTDAELSELKYYGESSGSMETGWMLAGIGVSMEAWDQGILTDISGGGMRFTTHSELVKGGVLYLSIEMEQKQEIKTRRIFAKVISSAEIESRPGSYENRVKFIWMNSAEQEEIIRFVFDEDRKRLKRERGNR